MTPTLNNITAKGFVFGTSGLEWVRPLPNPLPSGAVVTAVDVAELSLTYTVDEVDTVVVYTQAQIDASTPVL